MLKSCASAQWNESICQSRHSSVAHFSSESQVPAETKTSSDGVVGIPIDFDIASKIEGNESQVSCEENTSNHAF
jgi:hypothetical protein